MKGLFTQQVKHCSALLSFLLFVFNHANGQINVTGQITSINGTPVNDVTILVTGTENKVAYTDENGNYNLALQQGGSYEIKPLDCADNPLNGVSTFDEVLISKHFLGIEPLNSPYQIIAADTDNSGVIDTLDIVTLRSLILGVIPEFPGGNFRFILKDYVFPDPLDPFNPNYPNSLIIPNLQTSVSNADFFVVKIGDVNSSAVLSNVFCNQIELPDRITGDVFQDLSSDCQYNTGEPSLGGWHVSASNASGTFYSTTNSSGHYEINLLPGTYDVVLSAPNNLWGICNDTIPNVIASSTGSNDADFAVFANVSCPSMEVNLSLPFLRRCFNNVYKVNYCNLGTTVAENARVEVNLDPFFIFENSTVPSNFISGNKYSFEIGDVPSGECGHFFIEFNLSCDADLGQTHCTEARIFPDTICGVPGAWTGPDLKVEGICDGTDVKFTISNQGGDMVEESSYIVIEDIVVMMPPILNPFTLPGGGSEVITIPANGTTVRLEVTQPPGHPWSEKASATVEGCGTNTSGTFSTGMVNLFPQNDQSPFIDIDCKENMGSYDPNDKQGIPIGALNEHFIPLNQPIEYMIRFQNTGTDTAFTVIIRDTLDSDLNVTSIRPIGSSHTYSFNLSSEGVAQFVFTNIMLPDSNVNEIASHGYIKYTISPKQGLPEGSLIENRAAIYFDFNDPVITNTTWHTLGSKYLSTSVVFIDPAISLEVYPNPTTDLINFLLLSSSPLKGTLQIFDSSGKQVAMKNFEHNKSSFNAKELNSGYYYYKITIGEYLVAAGKVVKVD